MFPRLSFVVLYCLHIVYGNRDDYSCGRSIGDGYLFDKIIDQECRLKHVEEILKQFVKIDYTWLQQPAAPECPKGWLKFQDSCYLFSKVAANFTEADELCEEQGATLAHIECKAENNFIKKYLVDAKITEMVWFGLTDMTEEAEWKHYGTDHLASFTDWSSGEPNNQNDSEHCANLHYERKFMWNDDDCDKSFRYICEKDQDSQSG